MTKLATYTASMHSADFLENTITFEIDGNFKVRAGKYFIFSKEDLQNFADMICEKQREICAGIITELIDDHKTEPFKDGLYVTSGDIFESEQPNIDEL
ncbi:MAG: hypothetical protein LBV41_08950 [Cytophagaceae bacterium]|jgi:hypothetical protein|nr:hypothetical protein [Cytophagaceae bacterium]